MKIGDKAKIVKNTASHGFPIGAIVTIGKLDSDGGGYAERNGEVWGFNPDDVEALPVDFQAGPIIEVPKGQDIRTFVVKDSGERTQFESGMVRDVTKGKQRPDLIKAGPMFQRWIMLLTRGAVKYEANNWMKASGQEEYERFLESADRHFYIWYMWRKYGVNLEDPENPTTLPLAEDHAASTFFNINGAEYVKEKMEREAREAVKKPEPYHGD